MSEYDVYLNLILEMIERIEKSLRKPLSDEDCWDANLMRFQVIGENIKKLPKNVLRKHSEINWKKFSFFRNEISHEYMKIPETIVRSLIDELPNLKKAIIRIKGEIK